MAWDAGWGGVSAEHTVTDILCIGHGVSMKQALRGVGVHSRDVGRVCVDLDVCTACIQIRDSVQ